MAATRRLALLWFMALFAGLAATPTGCTLFSEPGDYVQESTGGQDTGQPDATEVRAVCEEMCGKVESICADFPQYDSRQQCLDVCEGLPDGTPDDYNGNTVYCRINHLEFANDDPATHCPHTNSDGGGVCVGDIPPPPPECGMLCGRIAEQCGGILPDVGDGTICAQRCGTVPTDGDPGDLAYHNIQCRESFLSLLEGGGDKVLCQAMPFEDALSQGCNDGPFPECQSLCLLYEAFCPGVWDARDLCIEDCRDALSSGFADAVDCALYTLVEGPEMCTLVDFWDPNMCGVDIP